MGFSRLKSFIYKLTLQRLIKFYQAFLNRGVVKIDSFANLSYSQEGEDLILKRIFEGQEKGFYIDIGAHHPKRFSNTYLFYKMGWKGINIDAMPGSMKEFEKIRPRDINIEKAISDKKESLKYYVFNETALNTFSSIEAEKKHGLREYRIIRELKIQTNRLSEILNQYLKEGAKIEFLSVDVEGLDFQVLKSNDWKKFRPFIILVEILDKNSLKEIEKNEIYLFLVGEGYSLYAKTANTCLFKIFA